MRYAVLLLVLLPLVCCQQCDLTWACITVAVSVALLLNVMLSLAHELRLLAELGQARRWPR